MDVRTEIKSTLPRKSSTSLISSRLSDEEEKDSISLAITSLERNTYGSTESKSYVKVYIWKPIYSKEIRKRCCSQTNPSKSGHVSMELFTSDRYDSSIPYDEKNNQYDYISFHPPKKPKCFPRAEDKQFRNYKSYDIEGKAYSNTPRSSLSCNCLCCDFLHYGYIRIDGNNKKISGTQFLLPTLSICTTKISKC